MTKLDLHGQNRYEAEVNLKVFLLNCYQTRDYTVVIAHGHGEYIMKTIVNKVLKSSEYVETFSMAPIGLGGAGATIVELKKKSGKRKCIK